MPESRAAGNRVQKYSGVKKVCPFTPLDLFYQSWSSI